MLKALGISFSPAIIFPEINTPSFISLFKLSHHRISFFIVISSLIVTAGFSFNANSLAVVASTPYANSNQSALKNNIADLVMPAVSAELEDSQNNQLLAAGDGVLLNNVAVFTNTGKGLRSDIAFHLVAPGETLGLIAKDYSVSADTLVWANNLEDADSLNIGLKLTIPPVSGVLHQVAQGETVAGIASKYKTDAAKITAYNDLETHKLEPGIMLVVPDGVKDLPRKKPVISVSRNFYGVSSSHGVGALGAFPRQGGHFPGGYCTSYVQYRKGYIPWLGDAKQWYNNSTGYAAHGSTPQAGAIYVEPGLTWSGHVSLVERVNPDGSFVVSEGNYVGYGWADERTITSNSGLFIYY